MDELWEKFIRSGKISDYLKYKSGERNADDSKRPGASGEKS